MHLQVEITQHIIKQFQNHFFEDVIKMESDRMKNLQLKKSILLRKLRLLKKKEG